MVRVAPIDARTWESFLLAQPYTLFVQSYRYGEFYQSIGEQYWIFGVFEGDALIGGSLALTTHAKRGAFLYVPYGPVFATEAGRARGFSAWREALTDLAKKERLHFLRVSPFWDDDEKTKRLFQENGFQSAPMHALAETTWLLDLRVPEDALLAAMNKNHRNLIRRCEREGVLTRFSCAKDALDRFHAMHDATAARHRFHRFSREYIEQEFTAFAPDDMAFIAEAYLPDGSLDSSAVTLRYGTMACYRHGASYGKEKKLPTSYLLQWEIIREAKRRGCVWYNFWGIAPLDARPTHPFAGITHFKKGFGGAWKNLLHCQDLPIAKGVYRMNWLIETLRRYRRGF